MKSRRRAGFTVIELIFLIGTLAVVAALAMPRSHGCKARRISCMSNIKQVGLAFRMWSNDHGDKFPAELTAATGGTKEVALLGLPLASFMIISNELINPVPLYCPEDKKRSRAIHFAQLSTKNISYFLGLDASEVNPGSILSGDRNLCINGPPAYRLVQTRNSSAITWGANIHKCQGNIGLADGSAHQTTDVLLQKALLSSGVVTNRFAIP